MVEKTREDDRSVRLQEGVTDVNACSWLSESNVVFFQEPISHKVVIIRNLIFEPIDYFSESYSGSIHLTDKIACKCSTCYFILLLMTILVIKTRFKLTAESKDLGSLGG